MFGDFKNSEVFTVYLTIICKLSRSRSFSRNFANLAQSSCFYGFLVFYFVISCLQKSVILIRTIICFTIFYEIKCFKDLVMNAGEDTGFFGRGKIPKILKKNSKIWRKISKALRKIS